MDTNDPLAHFLADPKMVLEDLTAHEEVLCLEKTSRARQPDKDLALHSHTSRKGRKGTLGDSYLGFAVRICGKPQPSKRGDQDLELAVRRLDHATNLLKDYHRSSSTRRADLRSDNDLELYAIIRALYRPSYTFDREHHVQDRAGKSRLEPGGRQDWTGVFEASFSSKWKTRIGDLARPAVRLERQNAMVGSGFIVENDLVATCHHVVTEHPENVSSGAATELFAVFNALQENSAMQRIQTVDVRLPSQKPPPDLAFARLPEDWLGSLPPEWALNTAPSVLCLTEIPVAELKDRLVAVIGHPTLDQRDNPFGEIDHVFGGAPLELKRLMPGRISSSTAYVEDLLVHDCSTLGGASGSCVIDLGFSDGRSTPTLGQVIGIHLSGTRMDENRALPAWRIRELLPP